MLEVESTVQVRYAETDQMGVVYYANYLVWMEVARVAYCREAGFEYSDMERESGAYLAVTEAPLQLPLAGPFQRQGAHRLPRDGGSFAHRALRLRDAPRRRTAGDGGNPARRNQCAGQNDSHAGALSEVFSRFPDKLLRNPAQQRGRAETPMRGMKKPRAAPLVRAVVLLCAAAGMLPGGLDRRFDLTLERVLNGGPPVYDPPFLLADLMPRDARRFTDFSGDLSGRYIGALAAASPHRPVPAEALRELVHEALGLQRSDGHFGAPLSRFGVADRRHGAHVGQRAALGRSAGVPCRLP